MKPASFGMTLRAYRLGYCWSHKHGMFIRMSTAMIRGVESNFVELCPADDVPIKSAVSARYHRTWWDSPSLLDLLPWLTAVMPVGQYTAFEVDHDGKVVKALAGWSGELP